MTPLTACPAADAAAPVLPKRPVLGLPLVDAPGVAVIRRCGRCG